MDNINREVEVNLPTEYGQFRLIAYKSNVDNTEHIALVKGAEQTVCKFKDKKDVLIRIHSQCFTGDVLHSLKCDCKNQLAKALELISKEEYGVLLYMQQEGRGIGLINKLKAYKLQEAGLDTIEANHKLGFKTDLRNYKICAQMLKDLGIGSIRLLTNNPKKMQDLKKEGIEITERISLNSQVNKHNIFYLKTKKEKLGHILAV